MAGYVIENLLTGKVKNFHWHDVDELDPGQAALVDVRAPGEYSLGSIPGFVNIPLDELRGRMPEIDKTKPVYIICQVGLRGYVASRILSQNGYDVYNLSGGYSLWNAIKRGNAKTAAPPTSCGAECAE
jgi:rhodanese-related sulfurtransferase